MAIFPGPVIDAVYRNFYGAEWLVDFVGNTGSHHADGSKTGGSLGHLQVFELCTFGFKLSFQQRNAICHFVVEHLFSRT